MLETDKKDVDVRNEAQFRMPERPSLPKDLELVDLSDNARTVLSKRYLRRSPEGNPAETVEEMFWRVAWHVAAAEATHDAPVQPVAEAFYQLLTSKRFFPNSPTFTGAGTPLGQLAACFVLPINDDMGRDSSGIFQTLRDAALNSANRRRQRVLLQPPAAQGLSGQIFHGASHRPGRVPAGV